VQHIKRFILFHGKKHPREMAEGQIRDYLSHLAVDRNVSASTQNVALAALLFLYRDVLKQKLERIEEVERARTNRRMPVVFTRTEVKGILNNLTSVPYLAAALMYGSGLRLMECLRLRVKDLDFSYNQIMVRSGKGDKDRVTPMPVKLKEPLRKQLLRAKLLHQQDLQEGFGAVELPHALARKLPAHSGTGRGSIFFQRTKGRVTRAAAPNSVIIFMKAPCKRQSSRLCAGQQPQNAALVIHCVTASRRTCSRMARIYERYKSC